jgi:hypothetical protein
MAGQSYHGQAKGRGLMESPTVSQTPIRTEPLPLEFPGAHHIDQQEIDAVARVLRSKSLFRYYGIDPQNEVGALEEEFAAFVGAKHALAVSSGLGALSVALSALGVGRDSRSSSRPTCGFRWRRRW